MKCSICGSEFGNGMNCDHCGADRVSALGEYNGYSPSAPFTTTSPSPMENRSIQSQSMPDNEICWKCSEIIPKGSIYCPSCGILLNETCPKCGYKYSSRFAFCATCGTNREKYLRQLEEDRKKKEEEERRAQQEIERQRKEEERRQQEIERQRKEEERRRQEIERQKKEEEERRAQQEIERQRKLNLRSYRIKKGFKLIPLRNEFVVTCVGVPQMVSLNSSAAFLWKAVEGRAFTVEDLTNLVLERYDVEEDVAWKDCEDLANAWFEAGLIE